MADEQQTPAAPEQPPQLMTVQLPLTTTVEKPGTLLMMMQVFSWFCVCIKMELLIYKSFQSPEQPVTLAAVKALLQYVKVHCVEKICIWFFQFLTCTSLFRMAARTGKNQMRLPN
jgi:hypothetical protein